MKKRSGQKQKYLSLSQQLIIVFKGRKWPQKTAEVAPPSAKRIRSTGVAVASYNSKSDFSGQGAGASAAGGSNGSTKSEISSRWGLRKRRNAGEKARRQRENVLFEELAKMCDVPADARDKSSVLKAVIKRVEELRSRSNGVAYNAGGTLHASVSVTNVGTKDGKLFTQHNSSSMLLHQNQIQGALDDPLCANAARSWNQAYGVFSQSGYVASPSNLHSGAGQHNRVNMPSTFNFPLNALSSNHLPIPHKNEGPNSDSIHASLGVVAHEHQTGRKIR